MTEVAGYPASENFYRLLALFHVFPIHAPITLLVLDAPFGRFALAKSVLNFPGNAAWFVMEAVAPVTFLTTLATLTPATTWAGVAASLAPRSRSLAGLYLTHYAHRAFASPLLLAPKRAPLHAVVVAAGLAFNLLNATLLANALVTYPPPAGWTFYLGIAMWAVGFAGNIYHDEILHDLRRPPGEAFVSSPSTDEKDKGGPGGRYRVPRGGLFCLVSFPNYLCEWLEWIGFAIAAAPYVLVTVPSAATLGLPFLEAVWPSRMLAAPWAFVLAEFTSMLPRAIRGHAWYRKTFASYPPERTAAVPWLI